MLLPSTTAKAAPDSALYLDASQPVDKRVSDLISRLTLEEKATLLDHRGPTVERFNIRSDQWNQCLNGVQWDRPTTLFPVCVAMSATWNTDLVQHEIATTLSDEARAIYNGWHLNPNAPGEHKGLIYRAPVINIERNPYWGRNHEAWGEDPFLTGRMAVAYVRGLQGDNPRYLKIAATLKHFAVNNVETDRTKLNANVSERMLHEYWLPHFHDAVVEGKAQSLMASYNAINGTPNNINHWLLTELLKNEWSHEGFVVSDLGGVNTMVNGHEAGKMTYVDAVAQSLMAGCDFSDREFRENIPAAVREGKLTEARLNDALARVLRVRFRLGEFDSFNSVPYSNISPSVIDSASHRAIALKAAQQSIVLLQNRARLLPLDKTKLKRIAVIGPLADQLVTNNYNGRTGVTVTALQGLKDRAVPGTEITYSRGCDVTGGGAIPTQVDQEVGFSGGASVKLAATTQGQYIQFAVNVPASGTYSVKLQFKTFPQRGLYRLTIDGADQGQPVDLFGATPTYGQVADFGTKTFTSAGMKQFRFTAVGKNAASDSYAGHFDKITLSGPTELSFEAESLRFTTGGGTEDTSIDQAVTAARGADVALVFIGTNASVEQEGRDRKTLGLTGNQEKLAEAVFAANPRTIVVEMSAGPLTVPWLKQNVPAMLQAWWPGEEGGHAIADVLFGDVNPAGRLPHTVYASEAQVPPQNEYDVTKGYTYMYLNGAPLFPFGHGLSYTQFKYSNLQVQPKRIAANGKVTVSVDVQNIGARSGDEVVQLYVHQVQSSVKRPAKELRGFSRISLQPGAKKTVTLTLPAEKLAFWDEKTHGFRVEPGAFDVLVGASSEDIRTRGRLTVTK
ncbi:xylan 1,4-beta-xylosidase [Abditibacteriota bacterium]|nr:xylan 1,4-beta-xylosidase [Abditibacteriota bacterium]